MKDNNKSQTLYFKKNDRYYFVVNYKREEILYSNERQDAVIIDQGISRSFPEKIDVIHTTYPATGHVHQSVYFKKGPVLHLFPTRASLTWRGLELPENWPKKSLIDAFSYLGRAPGWPSYSEMPENFMRQLVGIGLPTAQLANSIRSQNSPPDGDSTVIDLSEYPEGQISISLSIVGENKVTNIFKNLTSIADLVFGKSKPFLLINVHFNKK